MSNALVLNTKKFIPSLQQESFFEWVQTGSGSCVLEAVAGAGKTSTLVKALNMMYGSVFFGAYNKKIAEEIKARAASSSAVISTMHAAGFAAWRRAPRFVKVDGDKCKLIFRAACVRNMQYSKFMPPVLQLVSLAKQNGFGLANFPSMKSRTAWMNLVDMYDVETFDEDTQIDNTDLILKLALKTLEASIEQNMKTIDFDDMIYAPLYHGCSIDKYDWVLVDEAQDTNGTRRELALKMMHEKSRMVVVGDSRQAIYQFQGASSNAMDLIASAVNAVKMPLTTTFRCPKSVVELAHTWVSHIQADAKAPEGLVRSANIADLKLEVAPGDVVLCRYNAPLLKYVYQLIAAGIAAKIEGREIGNGIKALAGRWKVKSLDALVDKVDAFRDRETAKYRAKDQEAKAVAIEDKVACLMVMVERVRSINPDTKDPVFAINAEVDKIFSDDPNVKVVMLSSIHRSKGREWKKVVWLQTAPNKRAKLAWQVEAEANLNYVACTRSMHELVLIDISSEK